MFAGGRETAERVGRELLRRERTYRESRLIPDLDSKTVIVVDDGRATGASMRVAVQAVRELLPARTVAVSAEPESTCKELAGLADEVVCATTPFVGGPAQQGVVLGGDRAVAATRLIRICRRTAVLAMPCRPTPVWARRPYPFPLRKPLNRLFVAVGKGYGRDVDVRLFDAVLFDRDGTLIEDVPYNGDRARVVPMPGARDALDRLRAAGLKVGVVSNQSGVGRGLVQECQVEAVNRRVTELLGPFDTWQTCFHRDDERCRCRKPAPGMVLAAANALGVAAHRCVMVGDIGSDVVAGEAAGASAILVPQAATRLDEVRAATVVCGSLPDAVDRILALQELVCGTSRQGGKVLAVRADSAGDVLQTGPALRAIAARSEEVTVLAGPLGQDAARLLPGVDGVMVWPMPWIEADPAPVDPAEVRAMVKRLEYLEFDEAVVFTSYHQSPLPVALMLRLAGIVRISAISVDYAGSLLDIRHHAPDDIPEPVRALSLAAAAGFPLPDGDDGRLRVTRSGAWPSPGRVIVHAGALADARTLPVALARDVVRLLAGRGYEVIVTGSAAERGRTREISGGAGCDLGGLTTFGQLAELIAGASCMVTGNTGAAHLAAAQGTPVVSLYAPTVPFGRWGPYGVPRIRLGDADAPCRDTRARDCALPGHPCLGAVDPAEVVEAVETWR